MALEMINVSMARAASSGIPISCSLAIMVARAVSILISVVPLMTVLLALTTCWATSKIAMVISKVWDTR